MATILYYFPAKGRAQQSKRIIYQHIINESILAYYDNHIYTLQQITTCISLLWQSHLYFTTNYSSFSFIGS